MRGFDRMDSGKNEPVSVSVAKIRLREAAGKVGVADIVSDHPLVAVAGAVAAGFLFAKSSRARDVMVRELFRRVIGAAGE
ncbi:MAG: hypothetical protein HZA20_06290 [Nitrospirae bacterium]|nr:hypothetical protein [Nitrospirota bacterium]